jgi:hypothetical protein
MLVTLVVELLLNSLPNQELLKMSLPLPFSLLLPSNTKKRNRLDQKRLNDLVYVQYNPLLRRNQLLNKRPNSNPIVLEDIDPTSDWVVESHPIEFASDEDMDYEL